ncbi:hypothetical protein OEZ85_009159 [Tetradesmus obliquus]|uniref:Uncharacterized protein n=1 Tax=Tetradesmus obliquus TaxID=3088 RepID=A0ABY8TPS2_TETOB|nr:hypothetical protein OEZ85_009159 [Tetradesmus obliquus]
MVAIGHKPHETHQPEGCGDQAGLTSRVLAKDGQVGGHSALFGCTGHDPRAAGRMVAQAGASSCGPPSSLTGLAAYHCMLRQPVAAAEASRGCRAKGGRVVADADKGDGSDVMWFILESQAVLLGALTREAGR